jgi:hypothetical protein
VPTSMGSGEGDGTVSLLCPTCRSSPLHLPPPMPPHSTSPLSHYTSAPACVAPTLSSVSSSHPCCPYGHLHVRCQASPQASGSDPDGRMLRSPHPTSSELTWAFPNPDEAVIKVRWWRLNIVSTINRKLREGLSVSRPIYRSVLKHDCV